MAVLLISIAVLAPCFWHSRIEAGDLGSHTYNSWLAHLITEGRAPGLYIAKQWNNLIFDLLMDRLGPRLGFFPAEKLVVSTFVLCFFWGAFTLMTAAARRPPWHLLPAVWMISYGWTFQMGFMNFYLSMGISFFALAMIWRGDAIGYCLALPLAALALIAHPFGFIWLTGSAAYLSLAKRVEGCLRDLLFPAALLATAVVHRLISMKFRVHDSVGLLGYRFIGIDQLVLYSLHYRGLALMFLLVCILVLLLNREVITRDFWQRVRLPLEMFALLIFAAAMLWEGVTLPQYASGVTFIPERFTSGTAAILLCVLGCVRTRKWHVAAYACCALLFFGFLYRDTGVLCRMEEHAQALINSQPRDIRIIEAIYSAPGSRIGAVHLIARPCIGKCFDFTNYEPLSGQFLVRNQGSSPLVASSGLKSIQMREGKYVVKPEDLPLAEIYQCDERNLMKLCIRNLSAGQSTGDAAYIPKWLR